MAVQNDMRNQLAVLAQHHFRTNRGVWPDAARLWNHCARRNDRCRVDAHSETASSRARGSGAEPEGGAAVLGALGASSGERGTRAHMISASQASLPSTKARPSI